MQSLLPQSLNPFGRKFILAQLILWTTYGLIHRLLWFAYEVPPPLWTIAYMGAGFLCSSILAIMIWSAQSRSFTVQIVVSLIGAVFLGIAWRIVFHIVEWHVIEIFVPKNIWFYSYIHGSLQAFIHLLAWCAGYFLAAYYSNYLSQQERAAKAELMAKEAQIKLLHLQISPHFLFNVLNSLDTLLIKENIEGSREMLAKLSIFLRQTLSEEPAHTIPLKEEIARTKSYLDIELVRFGDKLDINWDIDKAAHNVMIPSLILQPLIENAIKHSVGKSLHGGSIEISARQKEQTVELAVINQPNGELIEEESETNGFGIGLDNVRSRLAVQYGSGATIEHGKIDERRYEVRIIIAGDEAEYVS